MDTAAQLNGWARIDRATPRQFPGNRAGKQRPERSRYQRAIPGSVKDGRKRQIKTREDPPFAGRSWKTWKMNGKGGEKGRARAAWSVRRAADHIAQKLARRIATSG